MSRHGGSRYRESEIGAAIDPKRSFNYLLGRPLVQSFSVDVLDHKEDE
jgi:hypothetical protein